MFSFILDFSSLGWKIMDKKPSEIAHSIHKHLTFSLSSLYKANFIISKFHSDISLSKQNSKECFCKAKC